MLVVMDLIIFWLFILSTIIPNELKFVIIKKHNKYNFTRKIFNIYTEICDILIA